MKYFLLAITLLFSACDRSQTPKIAEPQQQAIEKAKAVEQTMQKNADEMKKKIEEAGK